MTNDGREKYWFPAKRFSWGWGPPSTWQGWVVLLGYIALVVLNGVVFDSVRHPVAFPAGLFILTGSLIVICFLKGEPPSWRWGGSDDLP